MIELYPHSEEAYERAKPMLAERGKAAIIHPTGTGKSFIAFRLCQDNADKRVCWLSPSEYIYHTQEENLRKVTGGYVPDNIWFCTYARLMHMSAEEIEEIKPEYIILDEFHRCGARQWGEGVRRLLEAYREAPVLGLSATSVRYLDNQRDMSKELFDGCVASEMSLAEAVETGILRPPKYVISIFTYGKELKRYERRIGRIGRGALRDEAEKYLEALKRALDKADNIDRIIEKHIEDRSGKYIVFCSGIEHMKQMMEKAVEWFGRIDGSPHIYHVYSDDPSSASSFKAFKEDRDERHIKLLFCIDALNEGIHVDDVSGVILLRPTVSPIIYRQQIGRALAAGKNDRALILDIVMNIDNLCSIDVLKDEIRQTAIAFGLGEGDKEEADRFEIIDEVRDCRELFRKLSECLSASWEYMYERAREYYLANGDLDIPRRYRAEDGSSLGSWLFVQRKVYGKYSEEESERVRKLNEIGMIWESRSERLWKRYEKAALRYYEEHGDLNVPSGYVSEEGIALGKWLCQVRFHVKNGKMPPYMTEERLNELEGMGMVWDAREEKWEKNYQSAKAYYRACGNLDVPIGYVSDDGMRLGLWLNNIRKAASGKSNAYRLTQEQIEKLNKIGMVWESRRDEKWEKGFTEAESYSRRYGSLEVPAMYVSETGYRLGRWIRMQKERLRSGGLSAEQKARLESIGMVMPW